MAFSVICITFLTGCKNGADNIPPKGVFVIHHNNNYQLYRNGKPFTVKGAAGYTYLSELSKSGANTIRTWDTTAIGQILDDAQKNNLVVMIGLYLPNSATPSPFYNNREQVKQQYEAYKKLVIKYRNHPALLCWCVGNELPFSFKPEYLNMYYVFNNLVDMIHREDLLHPVTTTLINYQLKNIFNLRYRTRIDFISTNIFGAITNLKSQLNRFKWLVDEPFLVTEWGIEGPWAQQNKTAWGAYIESSSTQKADYYTRIYQKYMPVTDPRFMGSFAFYWGQKQECTPTWFSLFDEDGNQSQTISSLKAIWTGKPAPFNGPEILGLTLDNKNPHDDILLKPHALLAAKLTLAEAPAAKYTYKWEILPEDWYAVNGIYSLKKVEPIAGLIMQNGRNLVQFKSPAKEGPYRLYAYVSDDKGHFATANVPFYVLKNP